MYGNEVIDILIENASSFAERKEIFALTEAETLKINNEMVAKLFNSALNKRHIDFDDIPNSKGDITKYTGYTSMVSSLSLLKDIVNQSGASKIIEIEIIEKAISNIVANRDVFEKGFKLNKDFIILQYNTLVAACVAGTSTLIASYIDFVKTINKVEFKLVNTKLSIGKTCIDSLDQFNKSVASGDFSKVTNTVIKHRPVNEAAGAVMGIAAGIIFGVIALVRIIRYLIFYFYNSKQRLSDYLELQATFLQMNKNNLEANGTGLSAEKRNEIIKKQEKLMNNLLKYSDKLKVDAKITETKTESEIKKENASWKFSDVKSDSMGTDSTGIRLL